MTVREWLIGLFTNPRPTQNYCTLCERRIYWWEKSTRLYELGNTRAHLDCGARWLKDQARARLHRLGLEYEKIARRQNSGRS